MNGLTKVGQAVTMTSREIADLTGKEHDNVRRDIKAMAEELSLSFEEKTLTSTGGRPSVVYVLPAREVKILVTGYSIALRARVIDRLEELEELARTGGFAIPQTLPDALRLAADLADQNRALEQVVAVQAPKVETHDRIAAAEGSLCMRDAAKVLQMRPIDLRNWLIVNRWIYGRPGHSGWLAYQDRIQQGVMCHKVSTVQREDGTEKVVEQPRLTPKGLTRIGNELAKMPAAA